MEPAQLAGGGALEAGDARFHTKKPVDSVLKLTILCSHNDDFVTKRCVEDDLRAQIRELGAVPRA